MDLQSLIYLFVGISFAIYIGIALWAKAGSTKDFYVAGGGVPFPNAQPPSFDFISNSITKQDLAIMVQAINDKRVYIVESEIRGAHKKAEIFERNNEF